MKTDLQPTNEAIHDYALVYNNYFKPYITIPDFVVAHMDVVMTVGVVSLLGLTGTLVWNYLNSVELKHLRKLKSVHTAKQLEQKLTGITQEYSFYKDKQLKIKNDTIKEIESLNAELSELRALNTREHSSCQAFQEDLAECNKQLAECHEMNQQLIVNSNKIKDDNIQAYKEKALVVEQKIALEERCERLEQALEKSDEGQDELVQWDIPLRS
jgi:hypothetical protein